MKKAHVGAAHLGRKLNQAWNLCLRDSKMIEVRVAVGGDERGLSFLKWESLFKTATLEGPKRNSFSYF